MNESSFSYAILIACVLAGIFGMRIYTNLDTLPDNKLESSEIKSNEWKEAERKAENAVVQIFVQATKFNYKEPYGAPDKKQGAGSGFFINAEGYLLTNFHVVDGAKSIRLYIRL